MKILTKCLACKRFSLLTRKRSYTVPVAGRISSKRELCGRCARNIKKLVKDADPLDKRKGG